MKRKTYEKIPFNLLTVSKSLQQMQAENRHSRFMTSKLLDDGILMINLYSSLGIPEYRLFLDHKRLDYDTFIVNTQKWTKATWLWHYEIGNFDSVHKADKIRLNAYVRTVIKASDNEKSTLSSFISHCVNEKEKRAKDRRRQKVNQELEDIKDVPQEFWDWVNTNILNGLKARRESEHAVVTYLDKLGDNRYVLRYFHSYREYSKNDQNTRICTYTEDTEVMRFLFDEELKEITKYDHFWCWGYQRGYDDGWNKRLGLGTIWTKTYLYPENLKSVMRDAKFKYCGLEVFAESGAPINPLDYLISYRHAPQLEYFAKAGLTRYVYEITKSCWNSNSFSNAYKKKPTMPINEYFGFSKNEFKEIAKTNPTCKMFGQYRSLCEHTNASIKDFKWLASLKLREENFDSYLRIAKKYLVNFRQMLKYLEAESKRAGMTINQLENYYHDYLKMAENAGYDLSHLQVLMPYQLLKRHDDLIAPIRAHNEAIRIQNEALRAHNEAIALEKQKEKERKQSLELKQVAGWLNQRYGCYQTSEYLIVPPTSVAELKNEGAILGHCVAAQSDYLTNHLSGEAYIFFVREKDQPNEPFFTMEYEVDTQRIKQLQGKSRSKPTEAVNAFVTTWLNQVARKVKTVELMQQCG